MEDKRKQNKYTYWIKYIIFWIVFGAIFEMVGLDFNMGIVVAICILLFDDILDINKNKN
ncbi:MAG: hypothetical protein ACRCXT_18095 [Paraclostridium sp.]